MFESETSVFPALTSCLKLLNKVPPDDDTQPLSIFSHAEVFSVFEIDDKHFKPRKKEEFIQSSETLKLIIYTHAHR